MVLCGFESHLPYFGNERLSAMSNVSVNLMIKRHMPSVLAIEGLSFEYPWKEEDFIRTLRQRECIGMAALYGDEFVGYMVYEIGKYRIELLNMAVHPNFRRMFAGSTMIERLVTRLGLRRNRIEVCVRESNLTALNFFKSLGFMATGIVKGKYQETDEDAIAMQYVAKPQEWSYPPSPINPDARVK
jgi:ribosomal-protein-alanine N-acetyltransferase